MAIVYVKDSTTFDIVRIEEQFFSLVWTERYQEAGDFVLEIPLNVSNFDVYKYGNYIEFDDSKEVMIIEGIEIDDGVEKPLLKITGRSLSCILDRRVNASKVMNISGGTIDYNGYLGPLVDQIVKDDITEPYMEYYNEGMSISKIPAPERVIPNFIYKNNLKEQKLIDKKYNKIMTLYDILVSFAKKTITGFRIYLDESNRFVLELYEGTNRSGNQVKNSFVMFGSVMENVSYVNFYEEHENEKTIALSYREKDEEEFEQKMPSTNYIWVGNPDVENLPSGLERKELAVDSRSSASYNGNSSGSSGTGEPEMSLEEKMAASATDEFENGDYTVIRTSEGAVDPLTQYVFDKDYFLGDIVDINSSYGLRAIAIIDEVVRSYDESGYVVTPNFKSMYDYDFGDEGDPDDSEAT